MIAPATVVRSGRARLGLIFDATAIAERIRERFGGHPADEANRPHVEAAMAWMARAQDATGTGGVARGYSLTTDAYFARRGWQPAYPETTGYIIPTLYAAATYLGRPEFRERARRAARWECDVQLVNGGVRGGVVGQPEAAVVFNTGQVLFGWLAALADTGDERFAASLRHGAGFVLGAMDADGLWRRGQSPFTMTHTSLYDARVAWALAEVGERLSLPACRDAAARALAAVARRQHPNAWLPDCCLTDPERPLLHTLAYALRGLLEGGRVLQDHRFISAAGSAAAVIASEVRLDGWVAGRFDRHWNAAVQWNCLTGAAQMASVWFRLHELTGERHWIDPAERVLRFLKTTQNRTSVDPGLRGAIRGSFPLDGEYGPRQTLSWATKFFVDALMRHDRLRGRAAPGVVDTLQLA
jgi:hypothetical protein